jgi:sec-independent protein translocase protein TatB
MPQIGPLEIFVVAAIALIVFGPQKLPEIARTIGRFMSEVRRMAAEVKSEFDAGLEDDDDAAVGDEDTGAIDDAAPRPTSED